MQDIDDIQGVIFNDNMNSQLKSQQLHSLIQ